MKSYVPSQPRILLVEDDLLTLETMACILEFEGFSVVTAQDGKRGLDLLHESPRPSAVLLDLALPIVDGIEFIRRQKEDPQVADIPVIVITGSLAPSVPEATAIIPKPLDVRELKELLGDCRNESHAKWLEALS
jgi:CheY-like chemotaxis protein